ncbi:hypothetical protein ACFPLB_00125 [Aquamicrobium segne]|uniref:Uncharacterized protein n=1 Tax=Aquamicrobium segne TaxID=469547 RepID=A0ABW0GU60_9HYPH
MLAGIMVLMDKKQQKAMVNIWFMENGANIHPYRMLETRNLLSEERNCHHGL